MSDDSSTIRPTAVRGDLSRLVLGGSAALAASALGNGLSFAFTIFLARFLGPLDFGLYALGLTIFNTVALVLMFGLDTAAVKFISERLSLGRVDEAHRVLGQFALVAGCIGLAAGVGLAVVASPLATVFYAQPMLAPVLWGFALALPFAVLNGVLVSSLQACQSLGYAILVKYLWEPVGKFVLAGLLLWAGLRVGGIVTAIAITLVISTILMATALRPVTGTGILDGLAWQPGQMRPLLDYCLPLLVATLVGVVAPRSDILILGYSVSVQEVGVYLAAFQTASVLALVLGAFDLTFAPIIGRAIAQQDRTRLESSYHSVLRLSITLAMPVFLLLVLFAEDLLRLFGPDFTGGTLALIILATGQMFNSATGSANTVLLMSGASRKVMANTLIFGVLQIVATVSLIPLCGPLGAALAAAMSLMLVNVSRVAQVWRLHRVLPWSRSLGSPLLAGAVTAGLVVLGKGRMEAAYYPLLCLLGGGIYVACVAVLGWARGEKEVASAIISGLKPATNEP